MLHSRTRAHSVIVASTVLVALCLLTPAVAASDGVDGVSWSSLRFKATKLFITARAEMRISSVPSGQAAEQLMSIDEEPIRARSRQTLLLELHSSFLGRQSHTRLWFDPTDLAALQRQQVDSGGRQRIKTYRFGHHHILSKRIAPDTRAERSLEPAGWTRRSNDSYDYAGTNRVSEAAALFYKLATAPVDELREGTDLVLFASRQVMSARLQIREDVEVSTNYRVVGPDGSHERKGRFPAHRVTLEAQSADGEDELELLGLEGNVEILIDAQDRIPLEIRGRMSGVGGVAIRLTEATMR